MIRYRSLSLITFTCLATATIAGCSKKQRPVTFEPNLVHAVKYQIQDGIPMDQAIEDTTWLVDKFFGTPDAPKLPNVITEDETLKELLSMDRLMAASGPIAEGRGVYRKHCSGCHGITGNGRGPQGAILTPYPRDYRMGVFKFKSTTRGSKPTRADLAKLIANGIQGTAMVKIPDLSDQDVQALVDYVIYLSIRGEFERSLITGGVNDLDLEAGDRIYNIEIAQKREADAAWYDNLGEIAADTDSDELRDYENFTAFAQKLQNDTGFASTFASGDDDEIAAATVEYVKEKYASQASVGDEILKIDPIDGQETIDDLLADAESDEAGLEALQSELSDMIVSQYDDYVSMRDDLESDSEMADRLKNVAEKLTADELRDYEYFAESDQIALDTVSELATAWLDASDNLLEIPEPPTQVPVPNSRSEFEKIMKGELAGELEKSVQRGQELFVGKNASCSKCHGKSGRGDGQTTDYDDWTKDWTTRVGLKPENREALIPLLARGALPPQNSKPRNFELGLFHGGDTSADLYHRIIVGIEGSPMPAATFVDGEFEHDDVWHLINYIRSLQKSDDESTASP